MLSFSREKCDHYDIESMKSIFDQLVWYNWKSYDNFFLQGF